MAIIIDNNDKNMTPPTSPPRGKEMDKKLSEIVIYRYYTYNGKIRTWCMVLQSHGDNNVMKEVVRWQQKKTIIIDFIYVASS